MEAFMWGGIAGTVIAAFAIPWWEDWRQRRRSCRLSPLAACLQELGRWER